jgi:hypothetical protein
MSAYTNVRLYEGPLHHIFLSAYKNENCLTHLKTFKFSSLIRNDYTGQKIMIKALIVDDFLRKAAKITRKKVL